MIWKNNFNNNLLSKYFLGYKVPHCLGCTNKKHPILSVINFNHSDTWICRTVKKITRGSILGSDTSDSMMPYWMTFNLMSPLKWIKISRHTWTEWTNSISWAPIGAKNTKIKFANFAHYTLKGMMICSPCR